MLSNYYLRLRFLAITKPLDPRKDFDDMDEKELIEALEQVKEPMEQPFKSSILYPDEPTYSYHEHNFEEGVSKLIDLSPLE